MIRPEEIEVMLVVVEDDTSNIFSLQHDVERILMKLDVTFADIPAAWQLHVQPMLEGNRNARVRYFTKDSLSALLPKEKAGKK